MTAYLQTTQEMLRDLTPLSTVVRILLSVFLGALIGLNRGRQGRAAGLRTHALVCLGAAMAIMVGVYSVQVMGFPGDATRIGAQVVSGIGFLGVGTILTRSEHIVTGLTTAAGLWATASVGLAMGIGYYSAAIVGCVIVVLTMTVLNRVVKGRDRYGPMQRMYLEVPSESHLRETLDFLSGEPFSQLEVHPAKTGLAGHIGIMVAYPCEKTTAVKQRMAELREKELISFFMEDR